MVLKQSKLPYEDGTLIKWLSPKADALHVIYYGKPLAFSTGTHLILIGRTQQDVWLTREDGKTYKIQDFVAHSVEAMK